MSFKRFSAAFARIPGPVRGGIWMLAAAVCFAVMTTTVRPLGEEMHAFQIVFFRNLIALAVMTPWLMRSGLTVLRTDRHRLYLGRSTLGLLSMMAWFLGLTLMPLANATALSFTSPLFSTVFAVFLLNEIVRARRWTATIVGFLGAMIVLRPGATPIGFAEGVVLFSAALSGINACLVKQLTRTESANAIVTYTMIFMVPLSLLPALFVWTTPSWHALPLLGLIGLFGTLGHLFMTRAFAATDTSMVATFDFARLPFTATLAWLVHGEAVDVWTWVGGAVIAASSVYIARREAALARVKQPSASAPLKLPHAADD